MHCEQAKSLLFDFADEQLPATVQQQLDAHLQQCADCQTALAGIVELQTQANAWHEVAVPAWQAPRIESRFDLRLFTQWFPTLASCAALIMVTLLFLRTPDVASSSSPAGAPDGAAPEVFPAETRAASLSAAAAFNDWASQWESRQNVNQTLLTRSLLEASRLQRQQELEALARLIKAEMDRRSLETEDSLKYLITHQVRSQKEFDELSRYVIHASHQPEQTQ
jgi:anti-sigma factor RsiW